MCSLRWGSASSNKLASEQNLVITGCHSQYIIPHLKRRFVRGSGCTLIYWTRREREKKKNVFPGPLLQSVCEGWRDEQPAAASPAAVGPAMTSWRLKKLLRGTSWCLVTDKEGANHHTTPTWGSGEPRHSFLSTMCVCELRVWGGEEPGGTRRTLSSALVTGVERGRRDPHRSPLTLLSEDDSHLQPGLFLRYVFISHPDSVVLRQRFQLGGLVPVEAE